MVEGLQDHPIFTESIRRIQALLADRAAADPLLEAHLQRLDPLEREVLERCIHSCGDGSIALDLVFALAAADRRPCVLPADPAGASGPGGDRSVNAAAQPCPGGGAAAGNPFTRGPGAAAVPAQALRGVEDLAGAMAAGAMAAPGLGPVDSADQPAAAGAVALASPPAFASGSACELALAALRAGAPILTDTAMAAAAVAPMARRTLGTAVHRLLDWAPEQAPAGDTRSAAAVAAAWQALTASGPPPLVLIGSAPTALERLLDLVAAGAPAPALVIGMPVGFVGVAESKRRLAASGLPQIRLDGSRGGAGLVAAALNALLRRAVLDQAAAPS